MKVAGGVLVLALASAVTACSVEEFGETEQAVELGDRLDKLWLNTSHNTYEEGHVGYGSSGHLLTRPFDFGIENIEVDIRDTHYYGTIPMHWTVAHGYYDYPTLKCGASDTFSHCVETVFWWHYNHPNHPLLTVWVDKKQNWEGNGGSQRSPAVLDSQLNWFAGGELVWPHEVRGGYSSLRARVQSIGWPTRESLRGKVMFILTSDATCTGNDRLEQYVDNLTYPKFFIAPYATYSNTSNHITKPNCFDTASTGWVAIYNFEWSSGPYDGDCNALTCVMIPEARQNNFLVRAWDVQPDEFESAHGRPFGTSTFGDVNFIALDHPDLGFPDGPPEPANGVYP